MTVAFGFVSFTNAIPVAQTKKDNTDIENVLNTLKSSTDSILPQITSLASSGTASDATVSPLISDLTSALNTASSSLSGLSSGSGPSNEGIAELVASIITDIAQSLDTVLADASSVPELSSLLAGVDPALNQVLQGLEELLAGVLELVAALLTDVAGLLQSLAFGLTLASLNL